MRFLRPQDLCGGLYAFEDTRYVLIEAFYDTCACLVGDPQKHSSIDLIRVVILGAIDDLQKLSCITFWIFVSSKFGIRCK